MTATERIDNALDQLDATAKSKGTSFASFTVRQVARKVREAPKHTGDMMQQHRIGQRRDVARWITASRGYGRAAVWHVLAGPGADTKTRQAARKTAARWSMNDALARMLKDYLCEIFPALTKTKMTTMNAVIDQVIKATLKVFEAQIDLAEKILATITP